MHDSCPPNLLFRCTPSQIVDRADPVQQAEFIAKVQEEQKVLSVSNVDDGPVELIKWGTEFPIYGTKYEVCKSIFSLLHASSTMCRFSNC